MIEIEVQAVQPVRHKSRALDELSERTVMNRSLDPESVNFLLKSRMYMLGYSKTGSLHGSGAENT